MGYHQSGRCITFLIFNTFIFIFNIRLTMFSSSLRILHRAKHCQIDQSWALVYHFERAQVCPAQPLFPYYGNRTVNRQPSFRTEDSQSSSLSYAVLIFPFSNLEIPSLFFAKIIFSKILEIWDLINLTLAFAFLHFITSISIFDIRPRICSSGFLKGHRAKPRQIDHFRVVVYHFERARVCPAQPLLPYGNER